MKASEDSSPNMATLSQCITRAVEQGYAENFKVNSRGLVTEDEKSLYNPQDIDILNFYRFEGYTNPDDSSILYLIETNDGRRGTLVDAYGVYADADFSNFILQVERIQKKPRAVC